MGVTDQDKSATARDWPAPLPEVPPEPAPSAGAALASDPSIYTLRDGSRWLEAHGQIRQVAPPGTDHHALRWENRGLAAMDLAWRRAQTLELETRTDPDRHTEWQRTVQALVREADTDDIALLTAYAFASRQALEGGAAPDGALDAAHVAAELLWDAWRSAQARRTPDTGFDEFRSLADE